MPLPHHPGGDILALMPDASQPSTIGVHPARLHLHTLSLQTCLQNRPGLLTPELATLGGIYPGQAQLVRLTPMFWLNPQGVAIGHMDNLAAPGPSPCHLSREHPAHTASQQQGA